MLVTKLTIYHYFAGELSCNRTIKSSIKTDSSEDKSITISMPRVRAENKNKPLYCWYRFEGTHSQFIQIVVRDVRAGNYNEVSKE